MFSPEAARSLTRMVPGVAATSAVAVKFSSFDRAIRPRRELDAEEREQRTRVAATRHDVSGRLRADLAGGNVEFPPPPARLLRARRVDVGQRHVGSGDVDRQRADEVPAS